MGWRWEVDFRTRRLMVREFMSTAHHFPRVRIQEHRQVHELSLQPDVGDIGHPQLIDYGQLHPARHVEVGLQFVVGIRGHNKRPRGHHRLKCPAPGEDRIELFDTALKSKSGSVLIQSNSPFGPAI